MNAIVLTFDKQIGFAELVYKSYQHLWPDCPLEFRIPVNDRETNASMSYFKDQPRVTLVDTPSDIRSTMVNLLAGIPSSEWVFWCIDDRYPVSLDVPKISSIYDTITAGKAHDLLAIKLMTWRETLSSKAQQVGDQSFRVQAPVGLFGFWHHYFCRAGVLRYFFESGHLPMGYRIGDLTKVFHNNKPLPALHHTLVPDENIISLGEPCVNAELTENGLHALQTRNCPIPPYPRAEMSKSFFNKDIPAETYHSKAGRERYTLAS